jgi:hypothetical protein
MCALLISSPPLPPLAHLYSLAGWAFLSYRSLRKTPMLTTKRPIVPVPQVIDLSPELNAQWNGMVQAQAVLALLAAPLFLWRDIASTFTCQTGETHSTRTLRQSQRKTTRVDSRDPRRDGQFDGMQRQAPQAMPTSFLVARRMERTWRLSVRNSGPTDLLRPSSQACPS